MTYGRDDLMAIAAVRYCIGRRTYIVSDCVAWLRQVWPTLRESARAVIARDIREAIEQDDRARADGLSIRYLGDDCDRREWLSLRDVWEAER